MFPHEVKDISCFIELYYTAALWLPSNGGRTFEAESIFSRSHFNYSGHELPPPPEMSLIVRLAEGGRRLRRDGDELTHGVFESGSDFEIEKER